MCSGCSRTARETQNIPLAVPEQSIAPLKEMLKRSLPASSHLADREVFPFLFSLPKKPILERAPLPRKALHRSFPTGSRRRGPSADPVKRLFAHCASLDPQIDTQERMPPTINDHLEQPAGIQSSIAITSTCQSAGMLPSRCVSKPSQCGRHEPFSCPPKTFHATGIAHLHTTTLMDKIVQRSPNVVASKTSTSCRFPFPHRRTIHCNKGAKHEVTSSSRRFFPLLCFA